jgi:hypothetical protein
MPTIGRFRIRLKVDQLNPWSVIDLLTGSTGVVPNGNDLQLETGIHFKDLVTDISNIDQITAKVLSGQEADAELMLSDTLAADDLKQDLTVEDWNGLDPDDCHALFTFAHGLTKFDLGGEKEKEFWLLITAKTVDAPYREVTLAAGAIIWRQDGEDDGVGPVQGGNIIPGGAEYDGDGEYTLEDLTVGKVYSWSPGANDTNLVNGDQTLTEEGNFTAQDTSVVLNGTPLEDVTAVVRSKVYLDADESDARFAPAVYHGNGNPNGVVLAKKYATYWQEDYNDGNGLTWRSWIHTEDMTNTGWI